MDRVSTALEAAEEDARDGSRSNSLPGKDKETRPNRIERTVTASSSASSSSDDSISVRHEQMGRVPTQSMSRINTQRDIERHPTHLSRIETQRTQHSATVGAGLQNRKSKGPLPDFGAGKPYPPPLPEREEYVVEFNGPDDPVHPQNWTMKRKYVFALQ